MSSPSEPITPELLGGWGLPDPGASKKDRGRVIVVGGSRRAPGAVLLAGEAALRVGAGRLGVIVPASVEGQLGVMMPEAAVMSLPPHATDVIEGQVRDELSAADAVLVGPGFDNAAETRDTLLAVAETGIGCLVLDAYALGVLGDIDRDLLPEALVLNPNEEEAALLLGHDVTDDRVRDVAEIAERFNAVVNCYGTVVTPDGRAWAVTEGGPGLGTSGSGDVLAGAIAGFTARGVDTAHATVWATWAHARAGDRLTERMGLGFLARELVTELPLAVLEALSPSASRRS